MRESVAAEAYDRVRLHGEWKTVWYTKLLDVYTVSCTHARP